MDCTLVENKTYQKEFFFPTHDIVSPCSLLLTPVGFSSSSSSLLFFPVAIFTAHAEQEGRERSRRASISSHGKMYNGPSPSSSLFTFFFHPLL